MDYEKKYKEALENAKNGLPIEQIFPELSESEDEKNIRIIKKVLWDCNEGNQSMIGDKDVAKCIDWLEKKCTKVSTIECFETEFERQVSGLIASAINKEHEYNQGYVKWTANALLNYAKHEIEKQGETSNYNPYKATIESIADMVEKYANGDFEDFYDNVAVKCHDAIEYDKTWEKQGEQKPTPKFKIGDTIHKIGENTIFPMTIEKIEDGEYVCNNNHSFVNIKFQDDYELVEQKPAWSEDDKAILLSVKCVIDSVWHNSGLSDYDEKELQEMWEWLDEIWRRVAYPQPKQEWSEEDEENFNTLSKIICDSQASAKIAKKLSDWLKSLKERMKGE